MIASSGEPMVSVRKLTEATEQLEGALALAEQLRKEKEHAYEQVAAQRQRADKANDLLAAKQRVLDNAEKERDQYAGMIDMAIRQVEDYRARIEGGGAYTPRDKNGNPLEHATVLAGRVEELRCVVEVLAKGHAPAAIRIPGALESAGQLMDRVGVKALEVQESRRFGMAEVILGTGGLSRHDLEAVIRALKAAQ